MQNSLKEMNSKNQTANTQRNTKKYVRRLRLARVVNQ